MATLNGFLFIAAVITIVYQFSFFVFAAYFKFDKVTDLAGGSNFVILAIAGLLGSKYNQNTCTTRQILVSTLVIAWGVRLSAFLFYRILLFKKDRRFDGTRENPCRFLGFWIVQMAWVFIVSLPVLVLNAISNTCHVDVGYIEAIGVTAAGLGLILETWADHTKLIFKQQMLDTLDDHWCDEGPWKYSRHPNYFGEIVFWWGIFIACGPCFHDGYFLTGISPIFITVLLLGISGIPLLEKQANLKWYSSQDYKEYREETSPLIPLPRFFYSSLPLIIKRVLFFEWPLYEAGLHDDIASLVESLGRGSITSLSNGRPVIQTT